MFGFGHLYRRMITWSIIASLGVITGRPCSMSIESFADCQRDRFMSQHQEVANSSRYNIYMNECKNNVVRNMSFGASGCGRMHIVAVKRTKRVESVKMCSSEM